MATPIRRKTAGAAKKPGRTVPESVRCMLWGRAAGRCEFAGCNDSVHFNRRTKEPVNLAALAHIIGFSKDGPRGEKLLSAKLASDIDNLMLLCHGCHGTVDNKKTRGRYPVELLKSWKLQHERRVRLATGISPEKESTIVLYGANIGAQDSPLTYQQAAGALFPDWYPASDTPILLGMQNSHERDDADRYWTSEAAQLVHMVQQRIRTGLADRTIKHLSVFGIAPQPLLMLLGSLLTEIPSAEVYQLHREPRGWSWRERHKASEFIINRPTSSDGIPALVLAISATVNDDRITSVLGDRASIWRVTAAKPDRDFMGSKEQLRMFRQAIRTLMDEIKAQHGQDAVLHVFPAVPVSAAIEFGRVLMPKADMWIRVYDENAKRGGFAFALDLNARATSTTSAKGAV